MVVIAVVVAIVLVAVLVRGVVAAPARPELPEDRRADATTSRPDTSVSHG